MALKSTIFKADISISDIDSHRYGSHALTLARHPSETDERMMVRLFAFIFYADDMLAFGKGLSADDEPDLWQKDLTGAIVRWIDVGLPDEKRIRRACGRAQHVTVITYGGRIADLWWQQNRNALSAQNKLCVINLPPETSEILTGWAKRNMAIQCTRQDSELWLTQDDQSLHIIPDIRHGASAG